MEQRSPDVAKHYCAGQSSGNGTTPEISLGQCQLIFLATLETGFEPGGKICGRLNGGKIPEEQERSPDFRVVLRTALALRDVSLHAYELDTGERIVYEA
jgi:hypothetical protein